MAERPRRRVPGVGTRVFAAWRTARPAALPGRRALGRGPVLGLVLGLGLGLAAVAGTPAVAAAGNPPQPRKALLVLKDLPKGWRSSKSTESNQPFPDPSLLARCLRVPTSTISYTAPSVSSPQFGSKNGLLTVNDQVSTYPTAAAARDDFGFYRDPRTPTCFTTYLNGPGRRLFTSGTPAGDSMGSIVVSRAPASDFAPRTANLILFFPLTEKGEAINVQLTMVDYVKGTEEQTVGLTSVDGTFPPSLSEHLTALAVRSL